MQALINACETASSGLRVSPFACGSYDPPTPD
jgi:hypothetical protein